MNCTFAIGLVEISTLIHTYVCMYVYDDTRLSYKNSRLGMSHLILLKFSPYAFESLNKLILRVHCNGFKLLFTRTGRLHQRTG